MKKRVTIKKIITYLGLMFLFLNIGVPASAMDVSIAISPSKIYDKQINIGESKNFTFAVANNSRNVPNNSLKLTVNIEGVMESQYGEKIENNGIVKFDKNQMLLDINGTEELTATVNIPKNFIAGNYIVYVSFIQQPIEGFSLGAQTNAIKVPIYLFVGENDDYSKLKVDFDVVDNYLSVGEEQTTIIKEIFNNCLKVINPLNTIRTYTEISNKPVYNFKKDGKQIIDINNNIYTELKNVSITKDRLTDTKYVYYEESWLNEKIKNSKIENSFISINLANEKTVAIRGTANSLKEIQEQILNISKINKNATLDYLLDNLQVPKNINYEKVHPILVSELKSSSEIPITLEGSISTMKNNNEKIFEKSVISPTILPGEKVLFQNSISNEDINSGKYSINGQIKIRDIEKDINCNFEVKECRTPIIVGLSIFIVIYYVSIFLILRVIIGKTKKKLRKNIFIKNKKASIRGKKSSEL